MKKEYLNVELELLFFAEQDIVTFSEAVDNFIEDDWN